MKWQGIILGGCVAAAALITAGCGGKKPTRAPAPTAAAVPAAIPVKQPAAAAAPAAATAATSAASVTGEVVVHRFKPTRDPFRSVFEVKTRLGAKLTHPLQQYTIPQLKLLGIIWGIAQPVALVATPDSKEYIVKVGTPVGTGDGKIVSILPDRIVIIERYYDYRGTLQTEKYEMTLPSEE